MQTILLLIYGSKDTEFFMDNIKSSIGKISSGINRNSLLEKTIDFVQEQLPNWRNDPTRPTVLPEDDLNAQLCKYLESQARNSFPMVRFDHEERQTGQRYIDLSASLIEATTIGGRVFSIYDPFLVLECKRLPSPTSEREKEYVTGFERRSGGIQRFKLGLHGASLGTAVMIGYIQDGSINSWYTKINGWITELSCSPGRDNCDWKKDEVLVPDKSSDKNGSASYRSTHQRSGNTVCKEIHLHHLWLIMINKS